MLNRFIWKYNLFHTLLPILLISSEIIHKLKAEQQNKLLLARKLQALGFKVAHFSVLTSEVIYLSKGKSEILQNQTTELRPPLLQPSHQWF